MWFREPYMHFNQFVTEAHDLLNLTIEGIRQTELVLRTYEMFSKPADEECNHGSSLDVPEEFFHGQRKRVELAKEEEKNDFPLLHAHTLVSVWSALEAGIQDLLVLVLLNDDKAISQESLSKIKVGVAEFIALDDIERARLLVNELYRNVRADQKQGVNQFESVLSFFDLDGEISDNVQRDIFELQQLRHVLVHRAGVADRLLTKRCPWMGVEVGQKVRIDHTKYLELLKSTTAYFWMVTRRAIEKYEAGNPYAEGIETESWQGQNEISMFFCVP